MARRYFLSGLSGDTAFVTGPEAAHITRVMRAKPGDLITLTDGEGKDFLCRVMSARRDRVSCRVLSSEPNGAEAKTSLTLFVGLPKADKLEFITEKACELGARRIIPFVSGYCVAKRGKNSRAKTERLGRIAARAAKQCGRSVPPSVSEPVDFSRMVKMSQDYDRALFFYEKGGVSLFDAGIEKGGNIAIITGSEGGFTRREAERLSRAGAVTVSLGSRILRCETAAVAAMSRVMLLAGELE